MRDLLIITPTRGRPTGALRLAKAVAETCTAQTDLAFAIDDGDTSYHGTGVGWAASNIVVRGPRKTCTEWSNKIAKDLGSGYRAVASIGDDHLPRTHGWDTTMLTALDDMGGTGIVYGNDIGMGERLPTAAVISSDIPAALGWLMLPACQHLFVDNAWLDLGARYLPDVIIEHLHYSRGASPYDQTYADSRGTWQHDKAAYNAWRRSPDGMAADVDKIRALRADAVRPLGAVRM